MTRKSTWFQGFTANDVRIAMRAREKEQKRFQRLKEQGLIAETPEPSVKACRRFVQPSEGEK